MDSYFVINLNKKKKNYNNNNHIKRKSRSLLRVAVIIFRRGVHAVLYSCRSLNTEAEANSVSSISADR